MEECSSCSQRCCCLVLHEDVTWKFLSNVLLLELEMKFLGKNFFQVTSSSSSLFPRSAGSSQVHWEALEGQVQGGGPGSAPPAEDRNFWRVWMLSVLADAF